MEADLGAEHQAIIDRLGLARQALAVADARVKALRTEHHAMRQTENRNGVLLPLWARSVLTDAERTAHEEYTMAMNEELAAMACLTDHIDRRIAAANAGAAALAAGRVTA